METLNCSSKYSTMKDDLQKVPLMKVRILDVYSDIFTGIGKFPREPYKFQLKGNAKPAIHAPRKVLIHLQDAVHEEIRNLEQLGILEPVKEITEWVNSCDRGKESSNQFQQFSLTRTHSKGKAANLP